MRVVFVINNMEFSGGRKVFLEYACRLAAAGRHHVRVLTLRNEGALKNKVNAVEVPRFDASTIGAADVIVGTTPGDVRAAFGSRSAPVVHFCQGFEIDDLEQRVQGKVIPARYQGGGLWGKLRLFRKKFNWRARISEFDAVYRLDTTLAVISPHLKARLEQRYRRPVSIVKYGVHKEFFHPSAAPSEFPSFDAARPCRVVNIAPRSVTFKGVPTTLDAVRMARLGGAPVRLTRITPDKAEARNYERDVVDELLVGLDAAGVADVLRSSDAYISNSTEGEGFGLPAMEALSCGVPSILSGISSYRAFSCRDDFCLFVPEGDAAATARAIASLASMPSAARSAMSKAALEVSSEFSFDKALESFEKLLAAVGEGANVG